MNIDDAIQHLYAQPAPSVEIRGPEGNPVAYLVKPDLAGIALRSPGVVESPRRAWTNARPLADCNIRENRFHTPKQKLSKRQRASAKHEKLVEAGKRGARQDQPALA